MFLSAMLLLTALFLAGTFFLTAMSSAFRRFYKKDMIQQFQTVGKLFFYRYFHLLFFPAKEQEGLFFATICAQNITRFCYVATMLAFLSHTHFFHEAVQFADAGHFFTLPSLWLAFSLLGFVLLAFVIGDYLPRLFGTRHPESAIRICSPIASLFMLLVFPLTYLFLKVALFLSRRAYLEPSYEPMDREEIIDMIHKADLGPAFDVHDKQLLEAVLEFKERIVREVMVPRAKVFSLSADTSIKDAAEPLERERYSRIPVYRNSVDNIVGVLMYKDVLKKFIDYAQKGNNPKALEAPIETIQKPILHVPETKKLSSLLQEFRKKQVHLAIVVDEYGGTEGIVTIEDILEEIVGEIADEYDQAEELFYPTPGGGWVVDARLNILDAEEVLGIKIPQEGEYDTIGGYIYHITGTIPAKGFIIHLDEFDMEILQSNDRVVEKVRIFPVQNDLEEPKELPEE